MEQKIPSGTLYFSTSSAIDWCTLAENIMFRAWCIYPLVNKLYRMFVRTNGSILVLGRGDKKTVNSSWQKQHSTHTNLTVSDGRFHDLSFKLDRTVVGEPWRVEAEVRYWALQEQTASESQEEGLWRILPVWERQPRLQSPWNQAQSARWWSQGANDSWGEEGIIRRLSQEVWRSLLEKNSKVVWVKF